MKYSNVIITDDNMDDEMERLADQNEFGYNQCLGLYDELSVKFTIQENKNGYEEWISQKVVPNHSIDCTTPIVESVMAYEFGNGFMLFRDRDSMWD